MLEHSHEQRDMRAREKSRTRTCIVISIFIHELLIMMDCDTTDGTIIPLPLMVKLIFVQLIAIRNDT